MGVPVEDGGPVFIQTIATLDGGASDEWLLPVNAGLDVIDDGSPYGVPIPTSTIDGGAP